MLTQIWMTTFELCHLLQAVAREKQPFLKLRRSWRVGVSCWMWGFMEEEDGFYSFPQVRFKERMHTIDPSAQLFVKSFVFFVKVSVWYVHLLTLPFVHVLIHLFIHSFIQLSVHWFNHAFLQCLPNISTHSCTQHLFPHSSFHPHPSVTSTTNVPTQPGHSKCHEQCRHACITPSGRRRCRGRVFQMVDGLGLGELASGGVLHAARALITGLCVPRQGMESITIIFTRQRWHL